MNRREFTKTLGITAVAVGLNKSVLSSVAPPPQFAVTMDDFAWHNAVYLTAGDRNRAILDVLSAHRAKAALFVVGENAEEERGAPQPPAAADATASSAVVSRPALLRRDLAEADLLKIGRTNAQRLMGLKLGDAGPNAST